MKNKTEIKIIPGNIEPDETYTGLIKRIEQEILSALFRRYSRLYMIAETRFENILKLKHTLNILITDSDGIKEHNKRYRSLNKPTNILTFSYITDDQELIVQDNDQILLGEIILNWDEVVRDSGESGSELFESLTNLLSHGSLHLFGLEHSTPRSQSEMEKEKNFLMEILNKDKQTLMEA